MQGRWLTVLLIVTTLGPLGCDEPREFDFQSTLYEEPSSIVGTQFDESTSASVYGQVFWEGDHPNVSPFHATLTPKDYTCREFRDWPNPNRPIINPESRGVRHAVIFLRGVDLRKSRPWDHSPTKVVFRNYQMFVEQGDTVGHIGLVRRGTTVNFVNHGPKFEGVIARGASFFRTPLPDLGKPQPKRFDDIGVVELSSNATRYWQRSYLFVDDHPYYTLTDEEGRFVLLDVPPGRYELVCWVPSWHPREHFRDGDTGHIRRLWFREPYSAKRLLEVGANENLTRNFYLSTTSFEPPDRFGTSPNGKGLLE